VARNPTDLTRLERSKSLGVDLNDPTAKSTDINTLSVKIWCPGLVQDKLRPAWLGEKWIETLGLNELNPIPDHNLTKTRFRVRLHLATVSSHLSESTVVRRFTCPKVQLSEGPLVRRFSCLKW